MGLKEKILNRTARVGVIGLGYVGLPLAVEMARGGFRVVGIEVDGEKVALLRQGESYVPDVASAEVSALVREDRLFPTTDYALLREIDTISICVPTPLRKTKDPDVSYITGAVEEILKYLHRGLLIILESTTYPGTTEELLQQRVEAQGYKAGEDFYLCFSPERVDPGNPVYHTMNTPKVIGGATPRCLEMGALLYGSVMDRVVTVSSTRVAEMVKLLENTFRSVNIGLVNEIALMCDRMGIDVWEVIEAAATKPFGFMPFYPGPGIGGHCIPLDPVYLSWKARTFDFYNRFIDLASDINGNMPRYVVAKVAEALNLHRKCLNGSRILILGVAYKRDVDDTRESPGLEVMHLLEEKGALVDYHDPHVPAVKLADADMVASVPLSSPGLAAYDCVVLTTNHSRFDYGWIASQARLIVDTRNAFRGIEGPHIVRLGAPLPVVPANKGIAGRPSRPG